MTVQICDTNDIYLTIPGRRYFVDTERLLFAEQTALLILLVDEDIDESRYLALPKAKRLNAILESTDAGVWEWNFQTGEVVLSERWASMLGYRLDELAPLSIQTWFDLLEPADRAISDNAFERHFAGDDPFYHCEVRLLHKHGHNVWVRDYGRIVTRTADGLPEWISGSHIEISEYKQIEQALRASQETLATAQRIARLGHWQADIENNKVEWSSIIYEMLGIDPDSVTASLDYFRSLLHPDDESLLEQRLDESLQTGVHDVVHRIRHADGHYLWVHEYAQWQPGQKILMGTMHDVTRQKELELELIQLSRIDALTGLYNRRFFIEQLEQAISLAKRSAQPLALLIIDVDHFKRINDHYGHSGGDTVLQSLVASMQEELRQHDTLARVGGEEFAVLLPQVEVEGAMVVAEKLKARVSAGPFTLNGENLNVSITVGVCALSDECADWSSLYNRADKAMYTGKKEGRNRVSRQT